MIWDNSPLVTFIVPCYNYGRYLGECLESIFTQEGEHDFEVIAIDDASTDNTQEILRQFADSRLRVITHPKNMGHVATINEGLGQARGEFIARIDPDDRYRPHFLSRALETFSEHPDVGMVYGDVALIDDRGEITQERADRAHGGRDFKGNELIRLLEQNFICAPTIMARREAWLGALPVPKDLAFNDWYFTLMMARRYEFYYVNRVLADYRVHASNHHGTVVRNRSEEPSIVWLLDRIFSETEQGLELEARKQQSKRRIYAAHYLSLADKYFGYQMDSDARRCYLRALRWRPDLLGRPDVLRHLLGALVGRRQYEGAKALLKRRIAAAAPGRRAP